MYYKNQVIFFTFSVSDFCPGSAVDVCTLVCSEFDTMNTTKQYVTPMQPRGSCFGSAPRGRTRGGEQTQHYFSKGGTDREINGWSERHGDLPIY